MSQVLITLPTVPHVDPRSVLVGAVLIAAGILGSIAVDIYRRHYSAKKTTSPDAIVKLAKHWTIILLGLAGSAFTGLGYIIFLLQTNTSYFSTLPFVGKHIFTVIGVAISLYNIRLQKWFQSAANVLNKWATGKPKTPAATQPTPPTANLPETESNFEAL